MTNLSIFQLQKQMSLAELSYSTLYTNKECNIIEILFAGQKKGEDIILQNFCSEEEMKRFLNVSIRIH